MFRISERLYKEFKMICNIKGEYMQDIGKKIIADFVKKEKRKAIEKFGRENEDEA